MQNLNRHPAYVAAVERRWKHMLGWSKARRKVLRRRATPAELKAKELLKGIPGECIFQHNFYFQTKPPVRIVDFYWPSVQLAIELDGGCHYTQEGAARDLWRARQFESEYPNVKFLRFNNEEVFKTGFRERVEGFIFAEKRRLFDKRRGS